MLEDMHKHMLEDMLGTMLGYMLGRMLATCHLKTQNSYLKLRATLSIKKVSFRGLLPWS